MRDTIEKWDWARFAAVEARLVCRAVPMWCAGGFDVSRGASRTAGRKTLRTGLRARLMSLAGQSRSACEQRVTLSVKIILPSVRVHLFFGVRSQLDCSLGVRGCWSWRPKARESGEYCSVHLCQSEALSLPRQTASFARRAQSSVPPRPSCASSSRPPCSPFGWPQGFATYTHHLFVRRYES
jgi:hypothetical protein